MRRPVRTRLQAVERPDLLPQIQSPFHFPPRTTTTTAASPLRRSQLRPLLSPPAPESSDQAVCFGLLQGLGPVPVRRRVRLRRIGQIVLALQPVHGAVGRPPASALEGQRERQSGCKVSLPAP
ncbi:unnamed protein product [Linum tenue]|uniref:Uncharacterized protein n=1 Tax=Linum tenue TaxID=586396 RepID=A0AAV0JRA9_9ROSI|nr:unnamed protein product [Linum tenue]